jgi:hypothetical protein
VQIPGNNRNKSKFHEEIKAVEIRGMLATVRPLWKEATIKMHETVILPVALNFALRLERKTIIVNNGKRKAEKNVWTSEGGTDRVRKII